MSDLIARIAAIFSERMNIASEETDLVKEGLLDSLAFVVSSRTSRSSASPDRLDMDNFRTVRAEFVGNAS